MKFSTRSGKSTKNRIASHNRRRLLAENLETRRLLAFSMDTDVAAAALSAAPSDEVATIVWQGEKRQVVPGQWILSMENGAVENHDSILRNSFGQDSLSRDAVVSQRQLGNKHTVMLKTDAQVSFEKLLQAYSHRPGFRYLEPDFIVQSTGTMSNDPLVSTMYGLQKTAAPDAWDLSTGSSQVVVGVIDSGVDYTHPDLIQNMWVNPGEIPGDGIDNDRNGYVDDIHGYDFLNNDGSPMDDNRHGTHVAGTISARGDNGVGTVGMSWSTKIMALKFLGSNGSGPISAAVSALNYATMMRSQYGVNIVLTNNSWGSTGFSQAMSDAISANANTGMLFVAAAGNATNNNDSSPFYPAAYPQENIISVASTTSDDVLSSFSNYGVNSVDIAAPGSSILSTGLNGTYVTLSGTSMAAPHVSGAAALLWSAVSNTTTAAVKNILLQTADPLTGLNGLIGSGGRLNVANAMRSLLGDVGDSLQLARSTSLNQVGETFSSGFQSLSDGSHGTADVDLYRLSGQAGDVLTIDLVVSEQPSTPASVRIFSVDGIELASYLLDPSPADRINFTLPESANYFVGISADPNTLYDPQLPGSGTAAPTLNYRLGLSLDVGDTLATAKAVNLATPGSHLQYQARLGDGLAAAQDVDFYRFTATEGMLLTAFTSPAGSNGEGDHVLRLFDSQGNSLVTSDSSGKNTAALDYQVPSTGIYYVAVSGAGNATYNANDLSSRSPGITSDYSLTIAASSILPSTAAEFNLKSLVGGDGSLGFTMEGSAPYAELTISSQSIPVGDINQDGVADFVVSTPGDIGAGPIGTVYLVFGVAHDQGSLTGNVDIHSLNGINGYRIEGIELFDRTGFTVGGAGDVNGDGIPDLAIGAISASPSSDRLDAGQSYILFGGELAALDASDGLADGLIQLSNLNGTSGFTINGAQASGLAGRVNSIGDVNNDGFDDLLIGATSVSTALGIQGAGYVVFGKPSFPAVLELSQLDGRNGFSIPAIATSGLLGISVGRAGDFNGDGIDDFFIGATSADSNGLTNNGQLHVIYGNSAWGTAGSASSFNLLSLNGSNGFTVNGAVDSDSLGDSVASVGDFNRDGRDDLLILSRGTDLTNRTNAGAAFLLYGRSQAFPANLNSNEIEGTYGALIMGTDATAALSAVAGGGDFNGDGYQDLVVSSSGADPYGVLSSGQVYLVYGSPFFPSRFDLADLFDANGGNGVTGRVYNGYLDGAGMRGAFAGDINGDGRDDLRIAVPYGDLYGMIAPGQAYVVYGSPSAAGVLVSPRTGLTTSEDGHSATFQVVLTSPPTAPVVIPLAVSDASEGSISVTSLTFTPQQWQVSQTVTVTGLDDTVIDGPIAYQVLLGAISSSDLRYHSLDPADVSLTNIDNDTLVTRFYVVNDASQNRTFEYASDGTAIENYSLNSGNSAPKGVATTTQGDKVWVIDNNRRVYVYSSSGSLLGSWSAGTLASNAQPQGIATNGVDVWIVDNRSDRVYRYAGAASRLSGSQNAASNFVLAAGNTNPTDIVTNGNFFWVTNDASTDRVYRYSMTGTAQGNWSIDTANKTPVGIGLDPASPNDLWIVDKGTDRIYRYSNALTRSSGSQAAAGSLPLSTANSTPEGIAIAPVGNLGTASRQSQPSASDDVNASSFANPMDRITLPTKRLPANNVDVALTDLATSAKFTWISSDESSNDKHLAELTKTRSNLSVDKTAALRHTRATKHHDRLNNDAIDAVIEQLIR